MGLVANQSMRKYAKSGEFYLKKIKGQIDQVPNQTVTLLQLLLCFQ